ncbi:MAG: molybdopterin dinucleotide binding domain-containing protein [Bacteroidales bacterium]
MKTPSGKIELFSTLIYDMGKPGEIPAVAKYIRSGKVPSEKRLGGIPLQAMGHHYMPRVHSTHDNNIWSMESFPQRVFINPSDAEKIGIVDGEKVMIRNERGKIILPADYQENNARGG